MNWPVDHLWPGVWVATSPVPVDLALEFEGISYTPLTTAGESLLKNTEWVNADCFCFLHQAYSCTQHWNMSFCLASYSGYLNPVSSLPVPFPQPGGPFMVMTILNSPVKSVCSPPPVLSSPLSLPALPLLISSAPALLTSDSPWSESSPAQPSTVDLLTSPRTVVTILSWAPINYPI